MSKLEQIKKQAQREADRTGLSMGVFNLNRVGSALYVVREVDAFRGENRLVDSFVPTTKEIYLGRAFSAELPEA